MFIFFTLFIVDFETVPWLSVAPVRYAVRPVKTILLDCRMYIAEFSGRILGSEDLVSHDTPVVVAPCMWIATPFRIPEALNINSH